MAGLWMHDSLTPAANAVQARLRELASARNAPDRRGPRFVLLGKITMQSHLYESGMLPGAIDQWIGSEKGQWVLDNVSDIRAEGLKNAPDDSISIFIHSKVDEPFAVEHSLRWA